MSPLGERIGLVPNRGYVVLLIVVQAVAVSVSSGVWLAYASTFILDCHLQPSDQHHWDTSFRESWAAASYTIWASRTKTPASTVTPFPLKICTAQRVQLLNPSDRDTRPFSLDGHKVRILSVYHRPRRSFQSSRNPPLSGAVSSGQGLLNDISYPVPQPIELRDASPAANTTTTLCPSQGGNAIHCERRSTPYAWSYNDFYEPSPSHALDGSFNGISRPPLGFPHPSVYRTEICDDEIPSELLNSIPPTAGGTPLPPWAAIPGAVFDGVGNSATSEFTGGRDHPFSASIDSSPRNESSAQRYLDQCLDANPTPGEDTSPAPIGTTFPHVGISFQPSSRIEAGPWCPPPELLTDELLGERGLSTAERTSIHALAKLLRLKFDYSSPVPIPLDIPRSAKPDDSKTSSSSSPKLDDGGVLLETHITPEMQRVRKGLTESMKQNALQAKKEREVIFVNSKVTSPNPPPRTDAPYYSDQDLDGSPRSLHNLWKMPEDYDRFFDGLVNKTRANDSLRCDAAVELTTPSASLPPTSSTDWDANANLFPFAPSFDYARSGVYAITPREGHAERDKLPPSLYRYLRSSNNGNEDSGSGEATKGARPKRRLWPIAQLPR
ncbi:hypothetical protein NMY22_g439 [Coprinellus aureogranulatus]|nr:hypothetical protein NMY22_g439 [Coprinellus aureogranulatus]